MSTGADNSFWVLIVDDDASARHGVKEALTKKLPIARVVEAPSSHEAMAKIEKQRFHLVIMNHELPKAEGTFMDEICRLAPEKKPFGVIVGFSRVTEVPKFGNAHFLPKPIETNALLGVVKEVLESRAIPETSGGAKPVAQPAASAQAAAAPTATAQKKAPIDVNFINPFMEGAVVVLDTVCETKSERESVFTRSADSISGDISAVIAMNSSTKQGSFAISFEKKCFLAAAGRMLGEAYSEINEENKDVVGEICNQVFGYAKRKLNNEMGYDIQPAIPSVITGDNHQIKHLVKGMVIAAKFKTAEGWFVVEAAVSG